MELTLPAELVKLVRRSNQKPKTLHCDNGKDALRSRPNEVIERSGL